MLTNKEEEEKNSEIKDAENIPINQIDSENIPLKDNTIELINNPLTPHKNPSYAKEQYPADKLVITSEFFINGFAPFINETDYLKKISPVHEILSKLDKIYRPPVGEIQYRVLTKNYIDDFVVLLREHSPVKYDAEYFSKQFARTNSHFSFGAFIEINGIEYLIGYVLANLVKEKTFFQNVKKIYRTKTCFRSCLNYFRSTPERYGVISCLGVIDEYRRMGVGRKLLESMEEQLRMKGAIGINGIEYLIGYVLANLVKEKTFFQNVKKIYRTKTCFRSCLNYFRSTPERYGVISCLGVIDEYRRMGVGRKLLESMEEKQEKDPKNEEEKKAEEIKKEKEENEEKQPKKEREEIIDIFSCDGNTIEGNENNNQGAAPYKFSLEKFSADYTNLLNLYSDSKNSFKILLFKIFFPSFFQPCLLLL